MGCLQSSLIYGWLSSRIPKVWVKACREETNQASKWLAYALTKAEEGFRRIKGFQEMGKLHAALKREKVSA